MYSKHFIQNIKRGILWTLICLKIDRKIKSVIHTANTRNICFIKSVYISLNFLTPTYNHIAFGKASSPRNPLARKKEIWTKSQYSPPQGNTIGLLYLLQTHSKCWENFAQWKQTNKNLPRGKKKHSLWIFFLKKTFWKILKNSDTEKPLKQMTPKINKKNFLKSVQD